MDSVVSMSSARSRPQYDFFIAALQQSAIISNDNRVKKSGLPPVPRAKRSYLYSIQIPIRLVVFTFLLLIKHLVLSYGDLF